MNKQALPYSCNIFRKPKQGRIRNSNNLEIPLLKSKSEQRTFEYRGVKIWNSQNDELKVQISLTTIKQKFQEGPNCLA